jgi:hypothetical protein
VANENQNQKAKLLFFASCPKCKKKFGCEPKYIQMYLERLIGFYENRFKSIKAMLEQTQTDIKGAKKEG